MMVPDYLCVVDKAWSFIDQTMIISCDPPKKLMKESFESIPQWVLLTRLKETMWSKVGLEAIISTMGTPLEAE